MNTAPQDSSSLASGAGNGRDGSGDTHADFASPVQDTLVRIWTEVLEHQQVGVEDSFFCLGGTIHKAMRIVSRIRQLLGLEVPLSVLFDHPTISHLSAYLLTAPPGKGPVQIPSILPRGEGTNKVVASFSQQRLWFLQQMRSDDAPYNLFVRLRIRGPLSVAILRNALQGLVSRHESLRTSFAEDLGEITQVVASRAVIDLAMMDLSGDRWQEDSLAFEDFLHAEGNHRFDLARGPLCRAHLVRLSADEHLLLFVLHHIIADEWSVDVLLRELKALYEEEAAGRPCELPGRPHQYPDYCAWQKQWVQSEAVQEQLLRRKARLANVLAPLQLPSSKARPGTYSYRGTLYRFPVLSSVVNKLEPVAGKEGIGLFTTMLAAFQVLLHLYTDRETVVVGMPEPGRDHLDAEQVVGFFVKTLVVPVDLSGDPSFREAVRRVRSEVVEAFSCRDVPFELLVRELHPVRDTSYHPVFQVFFEYQSRGPSHFPVDNMTWEVQRLHNGTSKFDLTLIVEEGPDEVACSFEYNTDVFEPTTIERMASHFQILLESFAADPDRHILDIGLLTVSERYQLLGGWNNTQAYYPRDLCLHQLVEKQAASTPDQPAVRFEGKSLSYRELNDRANRLARYLQTLGVGPDLPVGLYLHRSEEMVIALLAILKAGGAYLPLDPSFPRDRLGFYLSDSRTLVLLTETALLDQLPPHQGQVVAIDGLADTLGKYPRTNLAGTAAASNLAYLIYTSGSTGKPKGVQLEHRSVVNFLSSMRDHPGLTRNDCVLAITTLSFDIHVLEVWLPLVVGGRVEVVSRDTAADGARLQDVLKQSGATLLQATPSTWRLLLASGWSGDRQLRGLCGGEALPPDLVEPLLTRLGGLWNMYGPTETTVWSTLYHVQAPQAVIPIGRPINNTRLYILNAHRHPVPIGVAGELYIGGEGLARGYWDRPELTAERFLPDPFDGSPMARMYRTGDLARYLPDGNAEYLGRTDHQVKVRGFRIELGEIEAVLGRHPAIATNIIVARPGPAGSDVLIAYVIFHPGQQASAEELRSFLRAGLPEYMLPSFVIPLESFPRTPNGKIDRKALPAPDGSRVSTDRQVVAPRSPLEERLVEIWQDVLKVKPIGVTDSFFDLGGHSLLAVVLIATLRHRLGQTLPLGGLFAAPTVEKMAAALENRGDLRLARSVIPLRAEGSRPPLFLLPGVGGYGFAFQPLTGILGSDQPVYTLKAIGVDGTEEPLTQVEAIARRYKEEIFSVRPRGPYYLGGYSFGGLVAYELASQLRAEGHVVKMLALFDVYAPGHPTLLPAYRQVLLHLRNLCGVGRKELRSYLAYLYERLKTRILFRLGASQLYLPQLKQADEATRERVQKVWDATGIASRAYRPAQRYRGKVLLFNVENQPQWLAHAHHDPLLGWGRWIDGEVDVRKVPGEHYRFFDKDNLVLIGHFLRRELEIP